MNSFIGIELSGHPPHGIYTRHTLHQNKHDQSRLRIRDIGRMSGIFHMVEHLRKVRKDMPDDPGKPGNSGVHIFQIPSFLLNDSFTHGPYMARDVARYP